LIKSILRFSKLNKEKSTNNKITLNYFKFYERNTFTKI
jgi:hypothetical protein